jgi:hypothetical protein
MGSEGTTKKTARPKLLGSVAEARQRRTRSSIIRPIKYIYIYFNVAKQDIIMNNNSNSNRKMRRTRESSVPSSASSTRTEQTRSATGGRRISIIGNNDGDKVVVDVSKTLRGSTGSSVNSNPTGAQLSGYDWYYVRGDASSAYSAFSFSSEESSSYAAQYNRLLLTELIPAATTSGATAVSYKSVDIMMKEIEELEKLITTSNKQQSIAIQKVSREEYYCAYNKALIYYGLSDIITCLQICAQKLVPILQSFVNTKSTTETDYDMVICHIVFLFFECVLALGVGRNNGFNDLITTNLQSYLDSNIISFIPTIDTIIEWLDESVKLECMEPQIRFLIPLYKSRLSLSEFDPITKLRIESATRTARKDMKTAMEIFHNKLRPSYFTNYTSNETDSVASSNNSIDEFTMHRSQQKLVAVEKESLPPTTTTTLPCGTPIQKLNQLALSVKAHLEQLKGNTKKSLILCSEALTATTGSSSMSTDAAIDDTLKSGNPTSTWYDAIHANNLAVIYATNGRKHLALHSMAKALRANALCNKMDHNHIDTINDDTDDKHNNDQLANTNFSNLFFNDGTVRCDATLSLLYNAAICGLRARNFISAYECMVTCIIVQPTTKPNSIFNDRTRCYLHLSEACIGIHSQIQEKRTTSNTRNHPMFASVEVDG